MKFNASNDKLPVGATVFGVIFLYLCPDFYVRMSETLACQWNNIYHLGCIFHACNKTVFVYIFC